MKGRTVVAVAAVVGVVATAGIGSALVGVGPAAPLLEQEQPPELVAFESTQAKCTDDFTSNTSTSVRSGGPNTEVTHVQNASLPDASHALGDPTFERVNESTYALSIPIEETGGEPSDCAAYARYEATVRFPAGDDPWRVVVAHDGETAITLFGDSDSSGASGSASAGGHVSGTDA